MRITGGQARGRLLATFKGLNIRPTTDQVREAVFNILGHNIHGKKVLDLFAGTGALGLEALSRGADKAVFIDKSPQALALIRKNIKMCGYTDRTLVLRRDIRKGIPRLEILGGIPFDLVFIDPPYRKGLVCITISHLEKKGIIGDGTVFVVETDAREQICRASTKMKLRTSRVYGDTKIELFEWRNCND